MFYVFYIGAQIEFELMKRIIIDIMDDVIDDAEISENLDGELSMCCEWFDINLNTRSDGIKFLSEDYKMDLKYSLLFNVYSGRKCSREMMLLVIGNILKQANGDNILVSNGESPVLERRSNVVVIDRKTLVTNPEFRFPFKKLDIEYLEGDLEEI